MPRRRRNIIITRAQNVICALRAYDERSNPLTGPRRHGARAAASPAFCRRYTAAARAHDDNLYAQLPSCVGDTRARQRDWVSTPPPRRIVCRCGGRRRFSTKLPPSGAHARTQKHTHTHNSTHTYTHTVTPAVRV